MAAFDTIYQPHRTNGFYTRLGTIFASVYSTVLTWNDRRLTRKALNTLTDRELDDIGLGRGDIDNIL